ncbi:MAG: glycolate oxidase FAD binding subunit [Methyloprofundus sp.]|nr:MAG: glycolate oxidase FAD binding subunit [Methyloprofundus sp.]
MPIDNNIEAILQETVLQAIASNTTLNIKAGGSKDFYGHATAGQILNIADHQGIINYEPSELVITARAGTSIKAIQTILAEQQQMLAFEPPTFADQATLGGTLACNFSGPRRAYTGAVRDYVLGCKIINGQAQLLSFGGQVMKNVAGYDVSRLMAGSMGTLGIILEASLKVIPQPEAEITLVQELKFATALSKLQQWNTLPLPISASFFYHDKLYIRLSGATATLAVAQQNMGGELLQQAETFWQSITEQNHAFFNAKQTLWRLSLAANTAELALAGDTLYEWGGALRWLQSDEPEALIRELCRAVNGHATLFRTSAKHINIFQPLPPHLLKLHQQIKQAFDPHAIFNIGRMYPEL